MKRVSIFLAMLVALTVKTYGQAPPGAQGRKIGDFANAPEPATDTLIRCGAVIDGRTEQPRKNIDIVLKGTKIVEVRPAAYDQLMSAGTKVIDLSNRTCLPGLPRP